MFIAPVRLETTIETVRLVGALEKGARIRINAEHSSKALIELSTSST
jgi:hypothetical protein